MARHHDAVPLGERQVFRRHARLEKRGTVDEAVRALPAIGELGQALDRGFVEHVDRQRLTRAFARDTLRRGDVDVRHHDLPAEGGQSPRRGGADAIASAGHDDPSPASLIHPYLDHALLAIVPRTSLRHPTWMFALRATSPNSLKSFSRRA